jgi:hypothetical protein
VALAQVLINTEGIRLVTRQFKSILELSTENLPAIIIEDDGEETITEKSGDFANIAFIVSIIGYVRTTNDLSTALNELDQLTKTALGQDFLNSSGIMRTAGLSGFRILPLAERSGTESKPNAFFEREVEITYEGRLSTGL